VKVVPACHYIREGEERGEERGKDQGEELWKNVLLVANAALENEGGMFKRRSLGGILQDQKPAKGLSATVSEGWLSLEEGGPGEAYEKKPPLNTLAKGKDWSGFFGGIRPG